MSAGPGPRLWIHTGHYLGRALVVNGILVYVPIRSVVLALGCDAMSCSSSLASLTSSRARVILPPLGSIPLLPALLLRCSRYRPKNRIHHLRRAVLAASLLPRHRRWLQYSCFRWCCLLVRHRHCRQPKNRILRWRRAAPAASLVPRHSASSSSPASGSVVHLFARTTTVGPRTIGRVGDGLPRLP